MRSIHAACMPATVAAIVAGAPAAHAQQPQSPVSEPLRVGGALTGGLASLRQVHARSADDVAGALAWGAEARVHPYGRHGFVAAFTRADGPLGPVVTILDAGYSLRVLGAPRLGGVMGAAYVDIGPGVGFVQGPRQTVIGARASLAFDLQIENVTIGVEIAYRGGIPLDDSAPWEDARSLMGRVGIAFDVARDPR